MSQEIIAVSSSDGLFPAIIQVIRQWTEMVDKRHKPAMVRYALRSGYLWAIAADMNFNVLSCVAFPEPEEKEGAVNIMHPCMMMFGKPANAERFGAVMLEQYGIKGAEMLVQEVWIPEDRDYPVMLPFYERIMGAVRGLNNPN